MNNVLGISSNNASGGGGSWGGATPEITVEAGDVTNGYISVPLIILTGGYTKVVRGGAIQDNSMYVLNSPNNFEITFVQPLLEGEVIKVFN